MEKKFVFTSIFFYPCTEARPPFLVDLSCHVWDSTRERRPENRLYCSLLGHWGCASHLCPVWLPKPVLKKASTQHSGISHAHFSTAKYSSYPEWIEIWNSIHVTFLNVCYTLSLVTQTWSASLMICYQREHLVFCRCLYKGPWWQLGTTFLNQVTDR